MTQSGAARSPGGRFTVLPANARFSSLADYLVIAIAVSLPWSTSATSILIVLWLLALIPTLRLAEVRRALMIPAGGLPILLWIFAAAGMLWADVTWADRLFGFRYFHKLLAIPLLLVHFRRSDAGWYALGGFLASCTALLGCSLVLKIWPSLNWDLNRLPGVPVKDRIVQSTEFMICAAASVHLAVSAWDVGRRRLAVALGVLALLFLANIVFVGLARTALVVTPCLLVLIGFQRFGMRGAACLLAAGAVFASTVWFASPRLQQRVVGAFQEIGEFRHNNPVTDAGLRLEFWRQSLEFMRKAPVTGNGTGSVRTLSLEAVRAQGVTQQTAMPHNPHNQVLAVGIQLGAAGVALLAAFWLAHLQLFVGTGLASWIGLTIVLQNILASLFNSHLFDFTPGWIYVFGVGILGGMALRERGLGTTLACRPPERL